MSINQNNSKVVSTCNQRITALTKLVKADTVLKINGQPMKLSELIAVYQACIGTRSEVVSVRAAFDKALAARDDAEVTRLVTDRGLKAWVISEFGASSTEAKELGFLPPKIGAKSAATKATAVAKLLATRKARHTMGVRQKEKITGAPTVPAAPAAPAVTTPAATPAAGAPASTNGAPNGASSANGASVSH